MKRPQKLAVMLVPTPPYEICGLDTMFKINPGRAGELMVQYKYDLDDTLPLPAWFYEHPADAFAVMARMTGSNLEHYSISGQQVALRWAETDLEAASAAYLSGQFSGTKSHGTLLDAIVKARA